jgi:amidase
MNGTGAGPSLAVKDLIDVVGVPTTAGSRAVADVACPAAVDAACMAGARLASARIVGKTNLVELAFGTSGINEWFGTPRNPLDSARVPGGSSSGSAVAVAIGDAVVAYGTDSGGSIRVPSAFCGVSGLKTTAGRIPLAGVRPLAPSLDTVGPMARDVESLTTGMAMLEPGFCISPRGADVIGRARPAGVEIDPDIDAAVATAIGATGLTVTEIALPHWLDAWSAGIDILLAEAAIANRPLLDDPTARAKLSRPIADRLLEGAQISDDRLKAARTFRARWRDALDCVFNRVEILALPAVGFFPPLLDQGSNPHYNRCTMPVNLAGLPALVLPVPSAGALPGSLQLVGPAGSEALLLATGALVESAAGCPIG